MTRTNSADRALRERAEAVIPGGMYGHQSVGLLPDDYPQFFSRAEGARLWDADGDELLDFMCAYGPNLFGYGDPGINAAFVRQMEIGDTLTGPTALMVELAEAFTGMVSHADWAMFCKNGTDATSMAMVTARAHTRRKTIVMAKGAYHGAAPWCTPRPRRHHAGGQGQPDLLRLQRRRQPRGGGGRRPATTWRRSSPRRSSTTPSSTRPRPIPPTPAARASSATRPARCWWSTTCAPACASRATAAGRRSASQPDLSTWGKCFANGHPISALLGSDKARTAAASIFVTGSFWYQAAPMAAALETLRLVRETRLPGAHRGARRSACATASPSGRRRPGSACARPAR